MIAIAGAVLFTILLVSANTMAQAIRERTNELAILKTLGFSDGRILGAGAGRVLPDRDRRRRARPGGGVADRRRTSGCRPTAWCRRSTCRRADVVIGAVIIVVLGLRDRAVAGRPGQPAAHRRRAEEGVARCCRRSSPSRASTCGRCGERAGSSAVAVDRHRRRGDRVRRRAVDRRGLPQRDEDGRRRGHRHGDARRRRLRDDQRHDAAITRGSSRTSRASPATTKGRWPRRSCWSSSTTRCSGAAPTPTCRCAACTPRAFQVHDQRQDRRGARLRAGPQRDRRRPRRLASVHRPDHRVGR